MIRLILLMLLVAGAYFGYTYYQSSRPLTTTSTSPEIVITNSRPALNDAASILGASIANTIQSGRVLLNDATAGKSDPLINQALANIQQEVKDLPKEAVDKVKYEFCKDIVTEYENNSTNEN